MRPFAQYRCFIQSNDVARLDFVQTSSSLTALIKLQPRTALLLPPAGVGAVSVHSVNGAAAEDRKHKSKKRGVKAHTDDEVKEIDSGLVQVR